MFKKVLSGLLALVMVISLSACGGSKDSNKEITLLKGQFSEITIIMEMAKIMIENETDLTVKYHDSMATVAASKSLINKDVDLYVSYDGTYLATILGGDPSEAPEGESLWDYTNKRGIDEKGLSLLNKFGFENTYAIAVKDDYAKENNIETVSDLVPLSKDIVFGAEHEFFDKDGTVRMGPLNEYYGFKWKDTKSLDIGLKYSSIDSNNIGAVLVYSTDGLNKKSNLKVLEDDKKFFPEYNAGFFMRDSLFEEYKDAAPNLEEVLNKLTGKIDSETMIELNYQVDAEKKDVHEVALKFLEDNGLV
ncbi:glycine/betaine ABC transporter substrate-binding protein [Erysipelotrichaceae bacterium OttesenSCG-928-M19]|nr:glycine/betaine ABC transporter substrate-binding protein [Erysipelotrichaceae bacterium OttesenSCG-928-M19]